MKGILILLLVLLLLLMEKRKKNGIGAYLQMKKQGEKKIMTEAAREFIGKECIVYLLSGEVQGHITQVQDRSMVVETASDRQLVNLDFVLRIREYPRKKNGKKKGIVID